MSLDLFIEQLTTRNLFAKKSGLKNIRQMCALAGHPERLFQSIHIAGTNGKGSVATKSAKGLECLYPRVGLYTSPHISAFNERIRINQTPISDQALERHLHYVFSLVEKHAIPATFFEIITLAAFRYFAEEKVNIAVIEVGLGGRFDATNVITPQISVITSISLEHTEILGSTILEIAKEKAGILKPGVPAIIGPTVPLEILRGRKALRIAGPFKTYDEENSALARAVLEFFRVPEPAISAALAIRPPCRLEMLTQFSVPVIFDVAHNPDGLHKLFGSLKQTLNHDRFHVVCALSKTKALKDCFAAIAPHVAHLTLTEIPSERAAPIATMLPHIPKHLPVAHTPSVEEAVTQALAQAIEKQQPLVICGTFYIMAAAKKALAVINYPEQEPDEPKNEAVE